VLIVFGRYNSSPVVSSIENSPELNPSNLPATGIPEEPFGVSLLKPVSQREYRKLNFDPTKNVISRRRSTTRRGQMLNLSGLSAPQSAVATPRSAFKSTPDSPSVVSTSIESLTLMVDNFNSRSRSTSLPPPIFGLNPISTHPVPRGPSPGPEFRLRGHEDGRKIGTLAPGKMKHLAPLEPSSLPASPNTTRHNSRSLSVDMTRFQISSDTLDSSTSDVTDLKLTLTLGDPANISAAMQLLKESENLYDQVRFHLNFFCQFRGF
jgi:hypothetical protein